MDKTAESETGWNRFPFQHIINRRPNRTVLPPVINKHELSVSRSNKQKYLQTSKTDQIKQKLLQQSLHRWDCHHLHYYASHISNLSLYYLKKTTIW